MVLFDWTPLDQRRNGGLLMSAEDPGLGPCASPLVGYLGKVNERAASLQHCPWCASKGSTHTLRSYRVNLKESITLCTNSDCLFPLVSRSLDDILASLVPVQLPAEPNRKRSLLEDDSPTKSKRLRTTDDVEESVTNPEENTITERLGICSPSGAEGATANGFQDHAASEQTPGSDRAPENVAASDVPGPPALLAGVQELLHPADRDVAQLTVCQEAPEEPEVDEDSMQDEEHEPLSDGVTSPLLLEDQQTVDVSSCRLDTQELPTSTAPPADLVSVGHLFWKNEENLCWLDSLLVVLVNCRTLRTLEDGGLESAVWKLLREYARICSAAGVQQFTESDVHVKVPRQVLQKADADLRALRMSIFKLLQPQLRCELGQRETPVFALPLLLKMDSSMELLFQASFSWEFECSGCKLITRDHVTNTLPTFTHLHPDWRPLHASHAATCNRCSLRHQRRTMVLERVPPVFALHFVEGLPQNNLSVYEFNFKGKHYSITSVIQYKPDLKHFVPWILQPEGSWLEVDDLKSKCQSHEKLPVPAREIHMVFWEEGGRKSPRVCSPTSTSVSSPAPVVNGAQSPDHSLLPAPDTYLMADVPSTSTMDPTDHNPAIGSTTLLDAFKGHSQNDIITLTLDIVPHPGVSELAPAVDQVPVAEEPTGSEASLLFETPEPVVYVPRTGPAAGTRLHRQERRGRSALSPQPSEVTEVTTPGEVGQPPSPVSSTQTTSFLDNQGLSYLMTRVPAKMNAKAPDPPAPAIKSKQGSARPPWLSTPRNPFQTVPPAVPKPKLRTEDGEIPMRASEMFSGFCTKGSPSPHPPDDRTFRTTTLPSAKAHQYLSMKHDSALPEGLCQTDALRYKLLKKLKAKKKKLAKLNEMLSRQSGASLQPDSTNLSSPHTVSSSCGEVLSELLSPATTVSNLSPDSSSFLDLYAGGGAESGSLPPTENFLDEFLCQAVAEQPSVMESDVLSELDLFF